jgi:hypothetical protein
MEKLSRAQGGWEAPAEKGRMDPWASGWVTDGSLRMILKHWDFEQQQWSQMRANSTQVHKMDKVQASGSTGDAF